MDNDKDTDIPEEGERVIPGAWLKKEIARKTAEAEERGDDLPIFSGMMNAFFGR